MTSVRFFASAALRPQEEIDGEMAGLLPRWAVVEYELGAPLTGIWRSSDGARRVIWYQCDRLRRDVHALHEERYGDEAYWVVTLPGASDRAFDVEARGADGALLQRRVWTFDRDDMPTTEEEYDARGALRCRRRYQCVPWGVVIGVEEERAPAFTPIASGRQDGFPIPELAGEPYPCGGHVGAARIVEVISQNVCQGRYRAVTKFGGAWQAAVATLVSMPGGLPADARWWLDLADPMLAPELGRGRLEHPRQRGEALRGVVEACPEGEAIEAIVARSPVAPSVAVSLAVQIADVLRRVMPDGRGLGAMRPELVYARPDGLSLALTGIMHRGPALVAATSAGEAVLVPPVFLTDFSSPDDVAGLAQLVWFMVTGGHPWYELSDVRWQLAWDDFHEQRRRRQLWGGPATLGATLEHAIFAVRRLSLDEFVQRLVGAMQAS